MKRKIIRWAAQFYSRDRGRILHMLGIAILAPMKMVYSRDARRYRQLAENYEIDKGRVDLVITMIGDRF